MAGLIRHGHRHARAVVSEDDLERLVREQARPGDMVVCLGAGTISAWANATARPVAKGGGVKAMEANLINMTAIGTPMLAIPMALIFGCANLDLGLDAGVVSRLRRDCGGGAVGVALLEGKLS